MKNCFNLRLKTRNSPLDLIESGSSFHSLIAVNANPLGKRDSSQDKWKLWLLPRVLWEWATDISLKFGKRYVGANLWRIRKRWAILKNLTVRDTKPCQISQILIIYIITIIHTKDKFFHLSLDNVQPFLKSNWQTIILGTAYPTVHWQWTSQFNASVQLGGCCLYAYLSVHWSIRWLKTFLVFIHPLPWLIAI